ncbi:hypothetical protein RRG08_052322 [Elysia crispata]|uniref:Uncharacterized protein n=1 Tax=Elysia crispata TaxID=231223 RepID=A0AAE1AJT9_9GAST|nr:hypothetical protein RRG08_052322 [Elysia crispata]
MFGLQLSPTGHSLVQASDAAPRPRHHLIILLRPLSPLFSSDDQSYAGREKPDILMIKIDRRTDKRLSQSQCQYSPAVVFSTTSASIRLYCLQTGSTVTQRHPGTLARSILLFPSTSRAVCGILRRPTYCYKGERFVTRPPKLLIFTERRAALRESSTETMRPPRV